MSTDTLLVILLVWTVAGLFVAIAFGRAIQESDNPTDDEILASSTGSVKYIRRNKHRSRVTRAIPAELENEEDSNVQRCEFLLT